MLLGRKWNATKAEADEWFACDDLVPEPAERLTRAIDVAAPADAVWPWFGQLRVAPYSYDLIDNFGRRSPREIDPSLGPIEVGQRTLVLFTVTGVEPGREFTAAVRGGERVLALGRCATTYRVEPRGLGASRIVVRISCQRGRRLGRVATEALGPGDLVMMRKQLRTLGALAEGRIFTDGPDRSRVRP